MNIIVGLGNPGEKYKNTRHNVGFVAVEKLAGNLNWQFNKKFNAEVAKDINTIYAKPMTFMNNSGQAVQTIMSYYGLLPKKLCVIRKKDADLSGTLTIIHDDLDIKIGKIKESSGSGSAGHNGVKSIINHLKTKNFRRIRIGIKSDMLNNIPANKFVLQRFDKDEDKVIQNLISNFSI